MRQAAEDAAVEVAALQVAALQMAAVQVARLLAVALHHQLRRLHPRQRREVAPARLAAVAGAGRLPRRGATW
jgi:hypothetical protein